MPGTFGIVAVQSRQWSMWDRARPYCCRRVEILSIAVAPEHRGAHVGAMLLDGASSGGTGGVQKLFLEVAEDNDVARTR